MKIWGRGLQAGGIVSAKALRRGCTGSDLETPWRPLWLGQWEQGDLRGSGDIGRG